MSVNKRIVIEVNGVSKSFMLPHERPRSLKTLFVNLFRRKEYEKQEVLRDISLEVKDGEFLGIVGRNGSGKSTLLKLLAGIYVPNEGTIVINGKLTPFIELGVGFNPELTGRENVYLNGALVGFSRKEMDKIYDDIVEFAELKRFMDQKLKNYSSGMKVRLAFSVAIQARTDILLIDEVLAVGDSNFQKKCFDVFETFKLEGRTIIFVSHSMSMVKRFCDRAILLDKGRIVVEGESDIVATEYEILNNEKPKDDKSKKVAIKSRREAHIIDATLGNFDRGSRLLEIGAADGRNVELLNSIGMEVYGVDKDSKPSRQIFKSIGDINSKIVFDGLLILDNRKSVDEKYLLNILDELSSGRLRTVYKVYIHLPFHIYHKYLLENKEKIPAHLGDPLDIAILTNKLNDLSFIPKESGLYGTDKEHQYVDAVYERFDENSMARLWD